MASRDVGPGGVGVRDVGDSGGGWGGLHKNSNSVKLLKYIFIFLETEA